MEILKLLVLFLLALVFAQDNVTNAPSLQSAEIVLITITTVLSTVKNFDTSAIVFITSDAAGLATLTTVTKDPGPPETFASTLVTTETHRRTVTVPGSSPSNKSADSAVTTNISATTTPEVSSSPASTSNSNPKSTDNWWTTSNLVIWTVLPGLSIVILCYAAYKKSLHRAKERADELRAFEVRERSFERFRLRILSGRNQVTVMAAPGSNINRPPNAAPKRPARPASLSESLLETMRTTPSAAMVAKPTSVRSAPAMMSRVRLSDPEPTNLVKKDLNRSNSKSSTTGQFRDSRTLTSTGVYAAEIEQLRAIEDGLYGIELQHRDAEKEGRIAPLLLRSAESIAANSDDDVSPATATASHMPSPRFNDQDESNQDIRLARRASAERKLNGESIRAYSASPSKFDPIATRAERIRIEQAQKKIADQQKKEAGESGNVTGFSAGPMPTHPPPPPPGPPPAKHIW